MILCLRMTLEMLISKEKSFFSAIILTTLSLILLGLSGMYLYVGKVNERAIHDCMMGGMNQTGIIKVTDFTDEQDFVQLKNDCMRLKGVKALGSVWNNEEMMNMAEWDISNPQQREVKTYALDRSAFGLMKFRFYKSLDEEEWNKAGEDYLPVYLGYYYKDTPLGRTFQYQYQDDAGTNKTANFQVVGILAKDQRAISPDLAWGVVPEKLDCTFNMNDYIVTYFPEDFPTDFALFFCNDEKIDMQNTIHEIQDVIKNRNMKASVMDMQTLMESVSVHSKRYVNMIYRFLGILLLSSVIMIVIQQMVAIDGNKGEYGIFITQGIHEKDICWMIILENMMRIGVAYSISLFGTYLASKYIFSSIQGLNEIFFEALHASYKMVGFYAIGLILLCSFVPIIVYWNYLPLQYLKGKSE